jgi:hypothetical protein
MKTFYTSGLHLKKKLGLASLPNVFLTRVLNAAIVKIYLIVYDSLNVNRYIPNLYCRQIGFPAFLSIHANKKAWLSPLVSLDKYEGPLDRGLFFAIDLAGKFRRPSNLDFVYESVSVNELSEITLFNLKARDAVSDLTQQHRQKRIQVMPKRENNLIQLIDVEINREEDWVTFKFLVEATEDPTAPEDKGELDQTSSDIKPNPSKLYEMHLKVLKFFEWLATDPDGTFTAEAVRDVLKVADIKIWSSDPSFWWQGMAYNLTQIDASIVPCDIAPKFWNGINYHGETYFLTKHLAGLFTNIAFWIPPMASMLNKRLKDVL